MPVVSSDFIAYSEGIQSGAAEIANRCAISRAYYGAYHACIEWHDVKLAVPGHQVGHGGGVHQQLINQLVNPDTSSIQDVQFYSRSLGYSLRALKDTRTVADYDLAAIVDEEMMENAREQAKLLANKASKMPSPPAPPAAGGSGPPLKRIR